MMMKSIRQLPGSGFDMAPNKNDYNRKEDQMLWEIHEIRHELSNEYVSMTVNEINDMAMKKYKDFLERKNNKKTIRKVGGSLSKYAKEYIPIKEVREKI